MRYFRRGVVIACAGSPASHPSDRLIVDRTRATRLDNSLTGAPGDVAHPQSEDEVGLVTTVTDDPHVAGDVDLVRRPAGAPSAGGLLGTRRSGWAAGRLRRDEAIRGGAHHGVSHHARHQHCDRAELQHRWFAVAGARGLGHPDVLAASLDNHPPRRRGRRKRNPIGLLCGRLRQWGAAVAVSPLPDPVNVGCPEELTVLETARSIDDPMVRQPDISLIQRELGWQPAPVGATGRPPPSPP